jgi:hypothetical protein
MRSITIDGALFVVYVGLAYLVCLALDAIFKFRIENSYIGSRGGVTTDPSFWSGFSVRHVVLIPLAALLQSIVRSPAEIGPMVLGSTAALTAVYLVLLLRDIYRRARAGSGQGTKGTSS